jgi:BirA family biotin operon repressor/biotin-[acetyl-CoA-carboxylase] ligase
MIENIIIGGINMNKTSERKQKVLKILHDSQTEYVSGQQLSDELGVSRTTIWKYIKTLREQGYSIDSFSKLGYRLINAPDILSPEEIKRDLKTKILGQEIVYYKEVESTNYLAEKEARKGAREGTIIIAKEQAGGKGRLGRDYFCPQGGIWFSIILRPDIKPNFASQLNFVAAVALANTIDKVTELNPGIKWPNDILINGRKVSGILTEMNAEIDQVNYIIIGLGINLNIDLAELPDELLQKATSIKEELGRELSKKDFFISLLKELELGYMKFQKAGGFREVLKEWKQHNITLGKELRINNMKERFKGKAIDIDEQGALVVKLSDGTIKKVVSGDVTLEAEYK